MYDTLGGYSLDPMVLRVEDIDLWCRFMAAGFQGYNMPDELYVILENDNSVKRRTFRSRINAARTHSHGLKTMGIRGIICYRPYISILKGLLPRKIYDIVHNNQLKKDKYK